MESMQDDLNPELNLLDALPADPFKSLLSIAVRKNAEAGSTLLREGQPGDALRIVLTGKVKVYKAGDQGDAIEIAVLGSGSVLGEMSLFDGLPNSASVICQEDCILLEIEHGRFLAYLEANPATALLLMRTVIHILSTRLRKANVHASSVASTTFALADKLADFLN